MSFEQSQPALDYYMVNFASAMFSPDDFTEDGTFASLPHGTGPFQLVEHEPDQYTVLVANDRYHGGRPAADKIRVKVIPDPNTRVAALKAEEIMGVMDLGAIQPAMAAELLKDDRFDYSVSKNTITHYITPNGNRFPFNDPRMRQAVSLLIDRDVIVEEFYGGFPHPTQSILNYVSPFSIDLPVEHDIEKAKALAEEVLGATREDIKIILPTWGLDRYPFRDEAEYLQYLLAELGLDAEIVILDGAAFNEALNEGDFHLARNIQGLPNGEPYTIFSRFMYSEGSTNKSYNLDYANDHVDALLEEIVQLIDMDARADIYRELQEISAADLPNIPVFHDVNLIVFNKQIDGYEALNYGTTLAEIHWRNEQ